MAWSSYLCSPMKYTFSFQHASWAKSLNKTAKITENDGRTSQVDQFSVATARPRQGTCTFGNQEGMITWCWLAEHACIKLVSHFKQISETHRSWVWSKHGYFILTWKRINMQQSAVFWWKSKRIFPTKNVLIRSLKNVWVGTAGVARSTELQSFMAAKLKVNFFVLLRVALLVLQLTLPTKQQCKLCWRVKFFLMERTVLDSRSYYSLFGHLTTSIIDQRSSFTPLQASKNRWIKLDCLKFCL